MGSSFFFSYCGQVSQWGQLESCGGEGHCWDEHDEGRKEKNKKEGKKLFLKINKIVVLASIGAHHCLAKLAIAKSTASERMEVSGRLTAKQQIVI